MLHFLKKNACMAFVYNYCQHLCLLYINKEIIFIIIFSLFLYFCFSILTINDYYVFSFSFKIIDEFCLMYIIKVKKKYYMIVKREKNRKYNLVEKIRNIVITITRIS